LVFRNAPRRHPWVNDAEADLIAGADASSPDRDERLSVAGLFRRMSRRSILNLFALNLQSTLSTMADMIYAAWIPLFLFEVHGLNFKEMGVYSALPLIGGALGGAAGGWLNDTLIRRTGNRRWSRSAVGLTGKGLAAGLVGFALVFYENPYVFCTILFFVKFFGDWSLTTGWGTVTDIGGRSSATVFAFNNGIAGFGSILAPPMYGYLAEQYNWYLVFVVAAVIYALCAASWLLVDCTIPLVREKPHAFEVV
jgi:sugar phosphate permease